jgi:hypothetical protein
LRCQEAQVIDAPRNCVWHQAAIHFNYLARCNCFPCTKERGEQ